MKDSIAFAVAFVEEFYDYEVTMIGHSKGGGEPTVGTLIYLPRQHAIKWWYHDLRKVDQHIANHQMGAVKKALEEAGY
jgi:hypothetical protein